MTNEKITVVIAVELAVYAGLGLLSAVLGALFASGMATGFFMLRLRQYLDARKGEGR